MSGIVAWWNSKIKQQYNPPHLGAAAKASCLVRTLGLNTSVAAMVIRQIQVQDAEKFLSLCKKLDEETKFMLFEPGERDITVDDQRKQIEAALKAENQNIFVAETSDKLVGFIGGFGRTYRRKRHCVHIVIGILRQYTNQGIGTKLLNEFELWARHQKIHRLELAVIVENEAGLALYKKMGFQIEGRIKDSLFVDGMYVDEYSMAKILDDILCPNR
jgi:RimJ/RimL family protein N-acetyltransferase